MSNYDEKLKRVNSEVANRQQSASRMGVIASVRVIERSEHLHALLKLSLNHMRNASVLNLGASEELDKILWAIVNGLDDLIEINELVSTKETFETLDIDWV